MSRNADSALLHLDRESDTTIVSQALKVAD
jgi:hypothetical protein